MKRKIGLFATLAMCLTFSGVYATWNFAESDISDTAPQNAVLEMGDVEVVAKGALEIVGENTLKFVIDDTDNNHAAELVSSGAVTVKYVPSKTEGGDTIHCAPEKVTMTCTITIAGDLFTVAQATLTKADAAEWTISASDLGVAFKEAVQLDTKQAYDEFKTNLADDGISLVISAS